MDRCPLVVSPGENRNVSIPEYLFIYVFFTVGFGLTRGNRVGNKVRVGNKEETKMKSKITFAALSLAIALGGASAAMAGGKKETADPRVAYAGKKAEHPNGRQSWCDVDPSCNGWGQARTLAQTGKLKF